ncbi:hypothetical protein GYMLUDRAFT_41013 [Collybiopsis luxurians FD-317 M1]|uniref:NAD(P)-binding protein n=1 Tax=Collybiopsis luxurians FD-317 M1 TaxID=944289 RepID=A0A0D0BH47_9AGAR|nr:hypothetical protein GYMLUDRAFT_41013 [Collybiopsis luxurians FD-317 M1]
MDRYIPKDFLHPLPVGLAVATAVGLTAYAGVRRATKRRLAVAQQANTKFAPSSHTSSYVPVAIFVGGTAGIGRGMAEAFAKYTKGNAHIIIIGRNEQAARAIISSFPKPTAKGAKHEFVYCDARLMKNIEQTTKELLAKVQRINFLVLSTMDASSFSKVDTEEGIEVKMALIYYSRFKFTTDLAPALQMARKNGEDAKVYYVAAPGWGKYINWEDLGLRKTYTFSTLRAQIPLYQDIILQELAVRHRSLTFIHAGPGVVKTGLVSKASLHTRVFHQLLYFFYPWTKSYSESGEFMLRALWATADRPGVWSVDEYGNELPKGTIHVATEDERRKLWEHTVEVTTVKSI